MKPTTQHQFHIALSTPLARRQNVAGGTFLDASGRQVSFCNQAASFSIADGKLVSAPDGLLMISAPEGVTNITFALTSRSNPISRTWSLANNRALWANESFSGGFASFCITSDGSARAFFVEPPMDCEPIDIQVVPGQ
jgi:hypothetical protein